MIFVQGHSPMTPQAFSDMQRWGHELEDPAAFAQLPEEQMQQLRYNIETAEWVESTVTVKVEDHVLGFGGMKAVQRAFKAADAHAKALGADWEAYALKEYFQVVVEHHVGGRQKVIEQFKEDVCMQWEAKALALLFNAANPPKRIDVVEPMILLRAGGEVYHAEGFLSGVFFKHNDPAANIMGMQEGFTEEYNYIRMTPQAFSHFRWA
eukprot:COSAG05_NODE_949_length_6474_cov_7.735216_2_plen_208_part_00